MTSHNTFAQLGLNKNLLPTLGELDYEVPTPIQVQSIPVLLEGKDLLAQAQTGTGKTAAFALPLLSTLEINKQKTQALILVPTRELAIQVAEACQSYAKRCKDFHVLPIYGGQAYNIQLRGLKRGAQIIVGTPGRIMDHLRRGTLKTNDFKVVILDEADEMLKMGFIEDIEWILEQIKSPHQTALFSATVPSSIAKIAQRYLKDPEKIMIKANKRITEAIKQNYMCVKKEQKLEALIRFLTVENNQATIVFTRTKLISDELASKLQARGYAAAALNGDLPQAQRKKVIAQLKQGNLDIVVATDVAARGIDVERVSHVINFDIPTDAETYIHRIGRTGRAGRAGTALSLITPREYRLLKDIEAAIHKSIAQIDPPTLAALNKKYNEQLKEQVEDIVQDKKELKRYHNMVSKILKDSRFSLEDFAASLVYLLHNENPVPEDELTSLKPSKQTSHKGQRKSPAARRRKAKAAKSGYNKRKAKQKKKLKV